MQNTPGGWTIIDGERRIWCREYAFAKQGTANCLIVGLSEGGVMVLSPAMDVSEAAYAELDELGPVRAVVATNGFHHLGLAAWPPRYPDARCFAPEQAFARIAKHNPQAGALEPLAELAPLLDEQVIVREAQATKCGELWVIARLEAGHLWFASDILANMPELPSSFFMRMLFKLSGSAPGYRVFHLAMTFMVKDKRAVLRRMLEDLERFPPSQVVPAHGQLVVGEDVAQRTRQVIESAL